MAAKSTALKKEKPVERKPCLSVLPRALVREAQRQIKLLILKDTKRVPCEVGERQSSEQSGKQNHPGRLQHGEEGLPKAIRKARQKGLTLLSMAGTLLKIRNTNTQGKGSLLISYTHLWMNVFFYHKENNVLFEITIFFRVASQRKISMMLKQSKATLLQLRTYRGLAYAKQGLGAECRKHSHNQLSTTRWRRGKKTRVQKGIVYKVQGEPQRKRPRMGAAGQGRRNGPLFSKSDRSTKSSGFSAHCPMSLEWDLASTLEAGGERGFQIIKQMEITK